MTKQRNIKKTIKKEIVHTRKEVFSRFPLSFTLLTTFGLVATFYGFEGIIDRIQVLKENPIILLTIGILILSVTGTLYKRLGS